MNQIEYTKVYQLHWSHIRGPCQWLIVFSDWCRSQLEWIRVTVSIFFSVITHIFPELHYSCGTQTLTCLFSKPATTCIWGVLIKVFQIFNKTLPEDLVAFNDWKMSLEWAFRKQNWHVLYFILWIIISTMWIIQLETVVRNMFLIWAEAMNDTTLNTCGVQTILNSPDSTVTEDSIVLYILLRGQSRACIVTNISWCSRLNSSE